VICTSGKLELSDSGITGNVTFRSKGDMSLSGSNWNLTPYWNNVLAYSDSTSNAALDLSGSNGTWRGIIMAPKGHLKFAGSNNFTVLGSLISNTMVLSGSNWTINANAGGGTPVPPEILLVE
jgi:hypothetical protein